MDIKTEKIIPDLRVYEVAKISRERGRARLRDLEESGAIAPFRTPTGRCLLSIEDAELLANAL